MKIRAYVITGSGNTPDEYIFEKRRRLARCDAGVPLYLLCKKNKTARNLPVSDWEYEWLTTVMATSDLGEAIRFVETGELPYQKDV